jgi:hypothetical protein
MEDKKKLLAIALKSEMDRLPEQSMFGDKTNFYAYEKSIEYLETGSLPDDWKDHDLLWSVVEDFEMICSDYEI